MEGQDFADWGSGEDLSEWVEKRDTGILGGRGVDL